MAEITKFYTTIRGTKLDKQIVAKSSFGNFQSLPNEMFVEILRHLSIDDLGILSMTSSKIRAFIISTFILSPNGIRKLNNYQCLNLKTLSINYISIIFDKLVNEIPQSIGMLF
ncbi:MAG: F-box protein [Enterobacterales bacterium endosymbiont of Blomia tropicalis]|uniref:F-box protein n=1 Tax=Mixta mediterraneensis TaxID=2758443 RepID=UPI0025A69923|nr:F-box protein [Mixta mediterraneensis]MDL4915946.1 F-box protein [Mixta mediterraneensis]